MDGRVNIYDGLRRFPVHTSAELRNARSFVFLGANPQKRSDTSGDKDIKVPSVEGKPDPYRVAFGCIENATKKYFGAQALNVTKFEGAKTAIGISGAFAVFFGLEIGEALQVKNIFTMAGPLTGHSMTTIGYYSASGVLAAVFATRSFIKDNQAFNKEITDCFANRGRD